MTGLRRVAHRTLRIYGPASCTFLILPARPLYTVGTLLLQPCESLSSKPPDCRISKLILSTPKNQSAADRFIRANCHFTRIYVQL
jgi:hypothetical protein